MTRCFVLLCSNDGDEVGARSQGHPEASCPGDATEADIAPNWDSYFDVRRSGDGSRACVSPGLQHLPDVLVLAAYVEALSALKTAVRGNDSAQREVRNQAAGHPHQLPREHGEFDGGVSRQVDTSLSCRSGTRTC